MRMIFVNLPVKDLEKSKAFFSALGFEFNPMFTNDAAACLVIDENIFAMLQTHEHFQGFINGAIGDPFKATQVLNCLSCSSREELDDLLARAKAAGAHDWKPVNDMGFMYQGSFQDLDGHVWELAWMDQAAIENGPPDM